MNKDEAKSMENELESLLENFPRLFSSKLFNGKNSLSNLFKIGNFGTYPTPEEVQTEEPKKVLKPKEIKKYLDQYVIGQEEAKISLSVAVYNHYKRINSSMDEDGVELQKSNILMIGKSGSGKTLLAQTIARLLDVPFVIADATEFTPTGIVGKDAVDIIKDLIRAANGDKKKAERGIVYIDEIDKIAGGSMSRLTHNVKGVLGGDTQATLLKLIEGNDIKTRSENPMFDTSSQLNTKNILFICGGAFSGIEDCIEKTKIGNSIGFHSEIHKENIDIWDKIGTEEIIKYGLMPELVGRLPVILTLKPLQKNDLIDILTKPKNAIIKQYQKLLGIDGVILEFTDDALEIIADMAIEKKIGARGLRGIVENVVTKIIFNLPDDEYKRKCVITAEHVKNNLIPNLILEKGK